MKKTSLKSLFVALLVAMCMVSAVSFAEAPNADFIKELVGTYEPLFPVICAPEYKDYWLERCAEYGGEENAQASADLLKSACTATIYGQEAVDAYADDPESARFYCDFTQGVAQITFDGDKISGVDANGKEIFAHTYRFVGMNEDFGTYQYKSTDADSGEFAYFLLFPDTPAETFHVEFRYGSDLETLGEFRTGPYAYWLVGAILTDHDEAMAKNAIDLFCKENLAREEE